MRKKNLFIKEHHNTRIKRFNENSRNDSINKFPTTRPIDILKFAVDYMFTTEFHETIIPPTLPPSYTHTNDIYTSPLHGHHHTAYA